MNNFAFLDAPSSEAAPRLLGCEFVRELDGQTLRVRIVEAEAYDQADMASHSYRGRTPRNDVMFGPYGHLYVYFTYGMHYCMNVVTGREGHGAGVLIRAVEPLAGEDILQVNRGGKTGVELTNGPAKVCQALQIDRSWGGHDLQQPPLQLVVRSPLAQDDIVQTTRVGISHAKDVPWRFFVAGNPYVSKV
jgi:DNA-3-methyladenine glycosylase